MIDRIPDYPVERSRPDDYRKQASDVIRITLVLLLGLALIGIVATVVILVVL